MEQFRRKRSHSARASSSNVAAIANRSSHHNLITSHGSYRGISQTARNKYPNSESVSRSCDCDMITDKHRSAIELGQRTSKRPAGTPMKSLLADEMSKETVYAKRVPGVIAKLMGLDGMPSPQSSYKLPNRSSDGFHQKTVSAGSLQHQKACNKQTCKKIAREEYKDVYEVREASRNGTSCCKSQMLPTMADAEDEMDIIRKKFMDAKRLFNVEKNHNSKEFHGETEFSDPNNSLFLKFLQDPDSLLEKHLHNLHASQESHCGLVRNLMERNTMSSNVNGIGRTDIKASNKNDCSLHHRVSRKGRKSLDLDKYVTYFTETNDLASDARTNIVLLRPKIQGSTESAKISTPRSSCEHLLDRDMHNNDANKTLLSSLDISSRKSRESKELAKEIARQMRNKLGETSFNVSLSGCGGGYSADESSHDVSGNDSSYESYRTLLRPSFHRKSSASRHVESSVGIEAKKRLSERWKKSHRSEECSLRAKGGSTLGQMLSFHDTDVRLPNLDGKRTQDRTLRSSSRNSKLLGAAKPLGISSKDGWSRTCSGPESLWTSYDQIRDSETCVRDYAMERFLIPSEGYLNGKDCWKKGVKKEFSWNDDFPTGIVSLPDKKVTNAQESPERRKEKNLSLHIPRVLESPNCRLDSMLTVDSGTVSEHVIISGRKVSCDDVMPAPEFISLQVIDGPSSSGLPGSAQGPSETCHIGSLQHCDAQPEPPISSSKVVDQPSPISVFDTPFVEDLSSSSECFERVSAELHGLRMQLKLLKMETGASTSTLVSSDEDEGTPSSSQGATLSAGCNNWKASYMADMLSNLEFGGNNPDSLMAMWHSPDCPVGPHVFENLEKKYNCRITSSTRSDRRLLFDYINSSILELTRSISEPHSLVKPSKICFEAELCKGLESAMKAEKEDMAENQVVVLPGKMEWMNLGESIGEIGCEIGDMLLDELVFEALAF